ncbi:MAG: class I SAM-dependent methyltransferase [Desulfobacterales bacterium]
MINKNYSENCRICDSNLTACILSDLKTKLGEVYCLTQCQICSFVSTTPAPSADRLAQYYDQDYWQRDNSKTAKLLNLFYLLRMSGIILNLKKLVPSKARILDWGAGDGAFQRLLERKGFDSYGIDSYSSGSDNKKIIRASIEEASFPEGFFDAITCFHVLEHIHQPVASVEKALHLLKPGGIFIVEVPNIASLGFKIFKKRWYPLDIPVHLNHFNPAVMQKLFEKVGNLNIIKTAHFSNRHSPSSLLLSLIPSFSPPRLRNRFSGRFPFLLMILYLFLQIISTPFSILGAMFRRGEIVRMYVRKSA